MAKKTIHKSAREQLLKIMDELSSEGELRLPGIRVLCEQLGASFGTVNSVVKRLEQERRVYSVPNKGTYIVPTPPSYNIAILVGTENYPNYIHYPLVMEGIFHVMSKVSCNLQILPYEPPERVPSVLEEKFLDACLWYFPCQGNLFKVKEAMESTDIAVFPIFEHIDLVDKSMLPDYFASPDFFMLGY